MSFYLQDAFVVVVVLAPVRQVEEQTRLGADGVSAKADKLVKLAGGDLMLSWDPDGLTAP